MVLFYMLENEDYNAHGINLAFRKYLIKKM